LHSDHKLVFDGPAGASRTIALAHGAGAAMDSAFMDAFAAGLCVEHLAAIKTPTLIAQGERDPFGSREEVAGYKLARGVQVTWIVDGDHSFKPRTASGRSEQGNWEAAIKDVVEFVQSQGRKKPH